MFRRVLVAAMAVALSISTASAQMPPPITELNVEGITVSELAVMAFRDTLGLPFVLSPEVYADTRPLAVHIKSEGKPFFAAVERYFSALGYSIERRGGILSVQPTPAPKAKEPPPPAPRFNRVYRPKYREVAYLVDLLRPLVAECRFGSDRGVSRPQPQRGAVTSSAVGAEVSQEQMASAGPASALGQLDRSPDVLVYNCTEQDRNTVGELLPQLDTPQGELLVRATIYEVSVDKSEASAVALAASLINMRLGLFLNSAVTPQQTAVTLKLNNLQAVVSALDQDHRFKVLSSPVARARSGSTAVFQSGQEVPVLGSVSYNGSVASGGSGGLVPIQSVQYRAAGVIFNVLPVQRENVIALDVQQELSDFVQTTTGVNNSPTLNKRSLSSSLSVQSGDVVLLGGLLQDKATGNSQGLSFLPAFLDATNKSDTRTEILLVLQVVPAEASGALVAVPGHLPVPVAASESRAE